MINNRLLSALCRQPVDRTPVWLMRQAGRYLPEYRQLRATAGDFLRLCKTPELACEVTLQPVRRFPLDAAILFSDILTIPDAMGLGLHFTEHKGPGFERPVRSYADIMQLPQQLDDKLDYVMQTVRLVRHELGDKLPLIGFAGSPWTLATYMVEGGPSKDFAHVKAWLYQHPEEMKQLLQLLAVVVAEYLSQQIDAGVDAVMVFDTWGGVLSSIAYQEFSLHYMQHVITTLRQLQSRHTPIILFTKNGGQWLEAMADSGCDALGVDWCTDLGTARKRVGDKVALQGNMDPTVLLSNPQRIQQEVVTILHSYGHGPGHIFNLGHGVLQQTPPEHVAALVEAVQQFSAMESSFSK